MKNPFRPGAGHMPPHLAGRDTEKEDFRKLLQQSTITDNVALTGLRGLGKTVLLEIFKPMAIQEGWLWVGTDMSESMSMSEENVATRLLTDLSVVTSSLVIGESESKTMGFMPQTSKTDILLDYNNLNFVYAKTPGLVIDKLKGVIDFAWPHIKRLNKRGLIFAYDEAQNMADHAAKEQYPLSLLLDLFQSIQRKGMPIMLVLTGLPTLFPKLVEARTFSERMFRVITLGSLSRDETEDAILKPIEDNDCSIAITKESIDLLWRVTQGYPYFIQFVCRECYDVWVQNVNDEQEPSSIPVDAITRKLDTEFFSGRWARATDRQRDLLFIVAQLDNCNQEFSVQDVVESDANKKQAKPFSKSHVSQILSNLITAGLVYKNRHGRYSLGVPLLADFIKRNFLTDDAA